MKILSLLLFPLLLFVTSVTVRSQNASEQAVSRLQEEVARREALERDENIPSDLKAQNRLILDKRRAELVTAIQARISALQKYIESLGTSATPEEKEYAQSSLRRLSSATTATVGMPAPPNRAVPSSDTVLSSGNTNVLLDRVISSTERTAITSATNASNTPPATSTFRVSGTVKINNEQFFEETEGGRKERPGYKERIGRPLRQSPVVAETIGEDGVRQSVGRTITDSTGNYSLNLPPGSYVISASDGEFKTEEPVTVGTGDVSQDLELLVRPLGEYSRAIVGFEQAAASAANSTQKFFFDLTLSAPLPFGKVDPYFGRRARLWGTGRITSVPQQINSGVATFAAGFAQQVGNLKVNEVAQGVEYLVGTEIRLTRRMDPVRFGSFDRSTTNRLSVAFIGAAGATTPTNPKSTIETFKVFAGAPGLPTIPAGKDFITFVSSDRDRFFREYYAGIRLQTYYFNYLNPDIPLKRFPAVLDITFGQNEAVTGGRLRGGVLRLEGFYPLPYEGMKFINLFGTALMRLRRTQITEPLILEPAEQTMFPANNVFLQTVPQINRDYYRIGVGIDFISLINRLRAPQQ